MTAFYVTHLMGERLWISERYSAWFGIIITEADRQYTFNLRFLFSPEFLPAAKPPSDTPGSEPDWWRATCGERCEPRERDRRPTPFECSEIQFQFSILVTPNDSDYHYIEENIICMEFFYKQLNCNDFICYNFLLGDLW